MCNTKISDHNWPVLLYCIVSPFHFPQILQKGSKHQATNSGPAVCEPHRLRPQASTALCGSSLKPSRWKTERSDENICWKRVLKTCVDNTCCENALSTWSTHEYTWIIWTTLSYHTSTQGPWHKLKWKCKSLQWQEPAWLAPGWFTRNCNASSCKWRTAKWMQLSPDASKSKFQRAAPSKLKYPQQYHTKIKKI